MNLHTDTSHHSFSVPDVSICDPSLALVFDWLTCNDLCGSDHFPVILKTSLLMMMNLHTGNSTGLTGCPSALCVCRGCLKSWPCLRIQWLSLQILRLRLQTKLLQNPTFLKNKNKNNNYQKYRGLPMFVNKESSTETLPKPFCRKCTCF